MVNVFQIQAVAIFAIINFNNVEPNRRIFDVTDKSFGGKDNFFSFACGDIFAGKAEAFVFSCFYFNKNKTAAVVCDNVDFSESGTVVPVYYRKTL